MQHAAVEFCPVHQGERLKQFCADCKAPLCQKCQGHDGHNVETIEAFYEKNKACLSGSLSFSSVISQLEERKKGIFDERGKLSAETSYIKQELSLKEKINKKGDLIYENELYLLESVNEYLINLEDTVSTAVFKEACVKALDLFNLENEIMEEFESLDKNLEDYEGKTKDIEEKMKKLEANLAMLECVKNAAEKGEFDEKSGLAYCFLKEKEGFDLDYRINVTVDQFRAFPLVEKILDIEKIYDKELVDIGGRTIISEPMKVDMKLRTGNCNVSLSHEGILAIYSDLNGNIVQFTNLSTNKQVEIEVENNTFSGFYDNKIILLTKEKPLRETNIEKLFNEHKIDIFEKIGCIDNINPDTDVSLIHATRILYYGSMSSKLYSFNVDTKLNQEINIGMEIRSILSLTGILCEAKIVFQGKDNKIYMLNKEDKPIKLNENGWNETATIFVSTNSGFGSIEDTLMKCGTYFVKGNQKLEVENPIKLSEYHSMVRVYKDIFLLFDKKTNNWVLCRIISFNRRPMFPGHPPGPHPMHAGPHCPPPPPPQGFHPGPPGGFHHRGRGPMMMGTPGRRWSGGAFPKDVTRWTFGAYFDPGDRRGPQSPPN